MLEAVLDKKHRKGKVLGAVSLVALLHNFGLFAQLAGASGANVYAQDVELVATPPVISVDADEFSPENNTSPDVQPTVIIIEPDVVIDSTTEPEIQPTQQPVINTPQNTSIANTTIPNTEIPGT